MEPSLVKTFFLLTFLIVRVDSHSDCENASSVAGENADAIGGQQTHCRGECDEGSVVLDTLEPLVYNPLITINAADVRATFSHRADCCNYSTVQGVLSSEMTRVAETYGRDEEDTQRQLQQLHAAVSDIARILTNFSEESTTSLPTATSPSDTLPRDCSDISVLGVTHSSVYMVQPRDNGGPVEVYCDMETDGGGWTVFQRRQDGTVDFYLDFDSYGRGFGSPDGEFWLGNENLLRLTSQDEYELRVDLTDFEGNSAYAVYSSFGIGDVSDYYRLTVGQYSGTAGDSMSDHHNKRFSTKDRDGDDWSGNCAEQFHGAWWYAGCYKSHLNGRYFGGPYQGVAWYAWRGNYDPLKRSEMKLRKTNHN